MASSENQGLQITLIVFIILTIILAATTFLFVRNYGEKRDEAEKLKGEVAKQTDAVRKGVEESERLRRILGMPEGAAAGIAAVEEQYKLDMDKWGKTFPEEKQKYRDLVEQMADTINAQNQQLLDEQRRAESLMQQASKRETDTQKRIEEYTGQLQAARDDLASERAKFKTELERITADNEDVKKQLSDRNINIKTTTEDSEKKTKQLTQEIARLKAQIEALANQLRTTTLETFEVADGKVVKVDMARKVVWINLGREDALRPRISFSVYSSNNNDVARYEKKGSLEVTNLLGPHLAEARIMEDNLLNPIVSGDNIYTPAWHPGRQEHFGLAGFLDLDSDNSADNQIVRDLIAMSGGVVDAELDMNGKRTGEMTINTRYLIQGVAPEDREMATKFTTIVNEAKSMGIEVLTLEKFLDHIGYKDPKRLLHFKSGKASDFNPDRADGGYPVSNGAVSDVYRRRQPGTSAGYTKGDEMLRPTSQGQTSDIFRPRGKGGNTQAGNPRVK